MIKGIFILALFMGVFVSFSGAASAGVVIVDDALEVIDGGAAGGKCNGSVDTNCTCTYDGNGCILNETCSIFVAGVCVQG